MRWICQALDFSSSPHFSAILLPASWLFGLRWLAMSGFHRCLSHCLSNDFNRVFIGQTCSLLDDVPVLPSAELLFLSSRK